MQAPPHATIRLGRWEPVVHLRDLLLSDLGIYNAGEVLGLVAALWVREERTIRATIVRRLQQIDLGPEVGRVFRDVGVVEIAVLLLFDLILEPLKTGILMFLQWW